MGRRAPRRDEPVLFDLPAGEPLARAKTLRDLDREARPRWTQYRPRTRIPCDECITLLHEAGGVGPYARAARFKRSTPTAVYVLCNEHARLWQEEERQ